MALAGLPSEMQRALTLFCYQLETDAFPPSAPDLALQAAKLLRLVALAAWPDAASSPAPSLAAVAAAADALRAAGPAHAALVTVAAAAAAALAPAASKRAAAAALAALVARAGDARTALVDHVVSAVAGGPECRCVMVVAGGAGGAVEEAVADAAVDMDALDVVVVAAAGGAAAGDADADAMAERLRAAGGAGAVSVVRPEGVVECLRARRVHAVLLDAVAVDGAGFVAQSGVAVVAGAARAAAVRVLVCAAEFDVVAGGRGDSGCVRALRGARGHPGMVAAYEDAVRCGARVRIVSPLWDYVAIDACDVLVSSVGAVAASRPDLVRELAECP